MLHDGAEDGGLDMLPVAIRLGDGDEIAAEEHAGNAGNGKQAFRERRLGRLRRVGNIEDAIEEHRPSRQEFQGGGIRSRLGLDEHLRLLCRGGFKARRAMRKIPSPRWEFPAKASTSPNSQMARKWPGGGEQIVTRRIWRARRGCGRALP